MWIFPFPVASPDAASGEADDCGLSSCTLMSEALTEGGGRTPSPPPSVEFAAAAEVWF